METIPQTDYTARNNIMIKGIITAVLILLMLVPALFVNQLVYERKMRHDEISTEVSSRWSAPQTLTGPYLFIPYKTYIKAKDGKTGEINQHYWVTPDSLEVTGDMEPVERKRSIYQVLLYRAHLSQQGNFIMQVPKELDTNGIQWNDIKICFGLSDFKGIEEKVVISIIETDVELSPGLPATDIDMKGLTAVYLMKAADIGKKISFSMNIKLKGSQQLHFFPLSGNSQFSLNSPWPNPSFDGNTLPGERVVNDSGFTAKWSFSKANLPFGTVLKDFKKDEMNLDFGVTMVKPADQYAKTERSTKYAILFIGLTFSLFFIVELMQKKPVHPVQYILIGLALVIFYALLLSMSEFITFDYAYLIAAAAIVSMITLYARSHFGNWRSAFIFCGILAALYLFIFVLIRLEDTALLIGSIGLFIVLAFVMYASRKIRWYGHADNRVVSA